MCVDGAVVVDGIGVESMSISSASMSESTSTGGGDVFRKSMYCVVDIPLIFSAAV